MTYPYDRLAIHLDAIAVWQQEPREDDGSDAFAAEAFALGLENAQPPTARPAKWASTLHSFEVHWARHGHAPRENTRNGASLPAWERRLGEWGRYQRRFERKLTSFQRIRLDHSPGFEWDPGEAAWDRALNEAIRLTVAHGRLPFLNGADPAEFSSARWLGRQLRQRQSGTLPARRRVLLEALLKLAHHTPPISPTPQQTPPKPGHGDGAAP